MPKRRTFTVEAWTAAAPAVVYRLLGEGAGWPQWSPIGSFRLEREGPAGGESEGAIRVFTTGTVHTREELVQLRPDRGLSYIALSGLPMRDHRADIELTERDGGTAITWREAFAPKYPGTGRFLQWFLGRFVQRCANGLAAAAATAEGRATTPN